MLRRLVRRSGLA